MFTQSGAIDKIFYMRGVRWQAGREQGAGRLVLVLVLVLVRRLAGQEGLGPAWACAERK